MFQIAIRQELKDWANMRILSHELRFLYPDEEDWWVSEAFATRRSESIEDARKILLDGLTLHYDSGIIRYNLACYACLVIRENVSIFLKKRLEGMKNLNIWH